MESYPARGVCKYGINANGLRVWRNMKNVGAHSSMFLSFRPWPCLTCVEQCQGLFSRNKYSTFFFNNILDFLSVNHSIYLLQLL